ncbi:hypothetical protein DDE18_18475 [Nocardioides gansuensis]|uniref:Uncharacterized protein n=1 Tax=Nocardioides gansuensis TaxID=2138300 RepID=A0A2T8F6W9_9ACTN|nr:hypothetical protein [Nocardioides gansuensis]PVG81464.1 hypothetical protein DDE18_18475 [Nocardioides gansuensis]
MTPTEHVVGFVAMALAILTILVVGTLLAADIIHIGHRAAGSRLGADAENDSPSTAQNTELATSTSGGNSNAHR